MTISAGPVLWPMAPNCDAAGLDITPTQWADAQARAVEWCWALSGRFYGTRATVYRPAQLLLCQSAWPPFLASIYGPWPGAEWNLSDPTRQQVLELPRPAVSVTSVEIDGTAADPELYRLEGNFLVRQDGGQWPSRQNMIVPLGNLDTWAVSYVRGVPVPASGQYAAGVLACELGKQIAGGKCRIAFNATTVTRAGVTINRDILNAARTTGVQEVDQWVASVNPQGLAREPSVWSPDVPRAPLFEGSWNDSGPPEPFIGAPVLVLAPGDPIPPGTAPGTIIIREA
jgi:hypothetical protein